MVCSFKDFIKHSMPLTHKLYGRTYIIYEAYANKGKIYGAAYVGRAKSGNGYDVVFYTQGNKDIQHGECSCRDFATVQHRIEKYLFSVYWKRSHGYDLRPHFLVNKDFGEAMDLLREREK